MLMKLVNYDEEFTKCRKQKQRKLLNSHLEIPMRKKYGNGTLR